MNTPFIIPSKNSPNLNKIVQRIRYKTDLFKASPLKPKHFSRRLIKYPSKLNTFNSKKTSPLPPIYSNLDTHFDKNLSVSLEKNFKNKVYKKKSTKNYHKATESLNFCLENMTKFNKSSPNCEKVQGNLASDKVRGKDFQGVNGKGPNRVSLNEFDQKLGEKGEKKSFRECDVQTNELDYNFHLIYDDREQLESLALEQLKLIRYYESIKIGG